MRAFSSSPNSLSSPPASLGSNPASPSNLNLNLGRANIDMDEIVVDTAGGPRFGVMAPPQPPPPDVPLTAAGLPRKKPGRKPGSTVKAKEPKLNPDGTPIVEAPKVRRPRKPRDPNAPPVQRKRKAATQDPDADQANTSTPRGGSATPGQQQQQQQQQQSKAPELASMRMEIDSPAPLAAASTNTQHAPPPANPEKVVKREGIMSLLNDDTPPPPAPAAPVRMAFDPVRSSSSYDPVRETMVTRDPYGTAGLSSPRALSQMPNRASASPSISSLVDPPPATQPVVSPTPGHASFTTQTRFQEASSLPASPSQPARKDPPNLSSLAPKAPAGETKKAVPPLMPQPPKASDTKASDTSKSMAPPTTVPAPSKKIAAAQAQTRKEKKPVSSSSSPKMAGLKNALPDVPPLAGNTSSDRSILDFGKAAPGEEQETPSIVIHIPLNGESNKYINFMRLAEETYGWDALHPRQAADRERKARIAAASAALEKQQSRGDNATGEEEDPASDDADSDENENADDSNVEMGGMGAGNNAALTSGAEGGAAAQDPEKPKRKRRNWREDEYDKMDGFVDDTDMLWEEQAAAVKDGFFVYSGPLVPEVPKPAVTDGPAKRGRGGRGRGGGPGSRGGRGGGEGGRGRGGGPGSRGGTTTRKPRITKLEKQRMETEKAERESMAKAVSGTPASSTTSASNAGSYGLLMPAGVPSLSAGIGPTGVLAGQ
ncbi:HIR complex subunit [Gnomoniopsis sp. IMI 355080]|nr:HIR complex subunit [Gnomoniopsis sp. IMI 355080]